MISHFQTTVIKYIIKIVYQRQNCPFLDGRTDGQSTKNLEEHLFCKLTLFTNGGTQKNSECCVMAALAIFKNGSQIFLKNFSFWVRVFSIFCTYISEEVFKPYFKESREEVQTICTIPQDGSHSSSSGCGKTPAEGSDARSEICPPSVFCCLRR